MNRFLAWLALLVGAACAIAYYGYVDVWVVPTDDPRRLVSIEPTLRGGDILLVQRHGVPSAGNLVRCTDPDEARRWVIGRLVATGGTALHLAGQTFSTPGSRPNSPTGCDAQQVTNPATGEEVQLNCRNEEFAGTEYQTLSRPTTGASSESDVHVAKAMSFLLSDDRYLHLDSRDYGSLPESSCQHILFRFWGAEGFGDGSRRFNIIW